MRKILAILLALTMIVGLGVSALAAVTTDSGKGGDASITITLPTDNAGTDEEITYHIYKVFDATQNGTAISYKIDSTNGNLSAAMTAAGFLVDDGGNVHYGTFTANENGTYVVGGVKGTITETAELTQAALDAIAAYAVDEIGSGFKAKPSDATLTITGLEYGYYYITTTTGTVVTVDSTNPNASVNDKNELPPPPEKTIVEDFDGSVDEEGKEAIAQVGTTVPFSVDIVKTKGATNYVFHDVMSAGLEYDATTLTVTTVVTTPAAEEGGEPTVKETVVEKGTNTWQDTPKADGDTLTVTFNNEWLAGLTDGTVIRIEYSAKVTSDALSIDYATNTATLDYGDGNTTDKGEVKVYNAKFTVTKTDGNGDPLEDAGFVLSKTVKVPDTSEGAAEGATVDKVLYYKITNNVITWVEDIEQATELKTEEKPVMKVNPDFDPEQEESENNPKMIPDGNKTETVVAFTGLADGTYTLIEKTVPEGYNKAADYTFTIKAATEDGATAEANLEQKTTVVNNSGSELPSTGGIGTSIFYIVGGLLAVGAGVVLVTKKRMSKEDI